jgi:hypothetical protein
MATGSELQVEDAVGRLIPVLSVASRVFAIIEPKCMRWCMDSAFGGSMAFGRVERVV